MAERTADIERGRDAVERESWAEAYDELAAIDPSELSHGDLEALADAAWWLSKTDESIAARQRAYAGAASANDARHAAGIAARLSIEHFTRRDPAVGAGWLLKAQRHAEEIPEGPEYGFLLIVQATVARFSGDLVQAEELIARAVGLARRSSDPNLMAMAIHMQGIVVILRGDVAGGVAMLDEAMTSVISGQLNPYFTGIVYCNVIGTCLEIADVRRADQWSEAARAWCETLPPESPFPGMCRVNRAEVARLRGAWSEAEAEATRASEELMGFDPIAAAQAFYETGEIRRRMGNVAGAEECFTRAREIGFDPQPGLALLRFGQGDAEGALRALQVSESTARESRLQRARLLAALVDVAIAVPDLDAAAGAADHLSELAAGSAALILQAMAATAAGAVRLARGDVPAAVDNLRSAGAMWRDLRLPYETAGARMLYGLALRAAGGEDDAQLELRAAVSAFERLGAAPDARTAAGSLPAKDALPGGLTAREAEVLRLVAAGRSNRDIATELVISEHTVARHLQNMFAKLGVSSRSGATAFAFEHGLT